MSTAIPPLKTINGLALEIARLQKSIADDVTELAVKHGVALEVRVKEDSMKLGLYHTYIHITNIHGVALGKTN